MRTDLPNFAIIGKMGSGKSTVAAFLEHRLDYQRMSFATPVRDTAAALWGEGARNQRDKLIGVGMKMREIDPDVWLNLMKHTLDDWRTPTPIVIDDCRFPNELAVLLQRGFVVVRVTADQDLRIQRLKASGKWQNEDQLNNASEVALDDFEAQYTIENLDTFGDLYTDFNRILEKEARRT